MTAAADPRITRIALSPDQRRVYESILDWARSARGGVLTVGGYAGTGKSTLLSLFASETRLKVAYICFTGRASSVLGRKLRAAGVGTTNRSQTDDERKLTGRWSHLFYSRLDPEAGRPFCGTIHRLIYRPLINDETEELFGWEKRDELDRKYDLIVLDEASMVDTKMVEDIRRHGVRVLAVGDHGQLPPVMGDGSLMVNPMLKLEKIHRQAEGSPIIRLSRAIREEHRMPRELADGHQLTFGSAMHARTVFGATVASPCLETAFLCWRNATRVHLNRTAREYMGFAGKPPQTGEPIVCLRNYPPVYNGMRGLMTANAVTSDKEWWRMSARIAFPDEGVDSAEYHVCRDQFHRHETFKSIEELEAKGIKVRSIGEAGKLFDFGYAMTVHKCVDPSTLVETPDGLVRAKNLPPRGRIATPSGWAMYKNLVRNQSGPMLEIRTEDGYSLRVTPDHGVDVWSLDRGYVRQEAKNIHKGDIVRLRLGAEFKKGSAPSLPSARPQDVRAKKFDLPKICNSDVAEFLGLMVADGTIYNRGFRLAKRHEDVADRFDSLCRKIFGVRPSRFFKLNAHHVEVNSTMIVDWLRDIGGMNPNDKKVPECILISSVDVQVKFLRGLFEDGTVNVRDGNILDHIEFSSIMPEVHRIVRVMLLRFGIVAGKTGTRPSLYLYGQHANRFGESIGFVSKYKQSRLENARVPDGTRYVFPLLQKEMHLAPQSKRPVIQRHRATGKQFADRVPFHHSTVSRIDHYSGESVCVEVPDGHRFIQDGFCGWNSQGSQFPHVVVVVDWKQNYEDERTRRLAYTSVTRASSRLTVLT